MYKSLLHLHHYLPYLLFLFLLISFLLSIQGLVSARSHSKIDKKTSLFLMILSHLQLLIGVCLYFISPMILPFKEAMANSITRLYKIEHPVMMIFIVFILTIIHLKTKKEENFNSHKKKLISYFLVIIILFFGIPWENWIF